MNSVFDKIKHGICDIRLRGVETDKFYYNRRRVAF